MTAYVISDVRGLDPDAVTRYRELAAASIARHGGRYLTRVGAAVRRYALDRNLLLVSGADEDG